ncbi:fumarate reductase/succinate dehydrogenase [Aspergillus ibericus CBS 121593]|uniref:Fumarate reductase/succinate dehydrogenase n=1 Tax=Aspergillus ibericus CBS 121593 TaxID=1448316 RepID=A0A395H546_9EURO|nr:fumarate reductase/succinate dehydrogenase [Aspergillus ibericus CBS 121593]RAL03001.1 fumarate reductase/succinate dehydrogenase [Aspergillus ibericus CBS 121593]
MYYSRSLTAAATVGSCCVAAAASNSTSFRSRFPEAAAVQAVDVVVVGGGASGANAAIHFKDAGLSLLLVEKQDRLGGMVNSWTDPTTGTNYDYGVATYTNYTGTVEFFDRLGVDIVEPDEDGSYTSYYADFTTGKTVDYVAPSVTDELLALESFYNVSSLYQDLFLPSYANWPAPDDIPEDLLMPFRDFAMKYSLNDTMLLIWAGIGAGLADMLDAPTLYLMQTFSPQTAAVFIGTDVQYVPASGRNQDIYDAAANILGESVMLNSVVVESIRLPGDLGVELLVQNQLHGNYTIILAKRLVMAIEPTASNMGPFSLDEKELAIFNQSTWSVVNTGIVSHPSLPVDGLIYNLPATAVNGNDFAVPEPPFVDYFEYLGNNLWQVIVVGWLGLTETAAQELANEAVQALAAAGTIPATNGTNLTIKAWSNHGAMDMRTTAENLKAGFIQRQYALQGHRSTYWTGGAFSNQLSTDLWAYNLEYLVPLVLESFN